MLKFLNLSKHLNKPILSKFSSNLNKPILSKFSSNLNKPILSKFSSNLSYSTKSKPNEHQEPEHQTDSTPKFDESIIDPFMSNFEYHNLKSHEKQQIEEFLKQGMHKKAWTYIKILTKNTGKFLADELFAWELLKGEKMVEDFQTDIVWQFKDKKDIKGWLIASDAMMERGYSTVNLDVNKQGRLVFSGFIDADHFPADGMLDYVGYAHMSSPFQKTGFGLEGYFNWSMFNHLIIRFKGDGRVYKILLKGPGMMGTQENSHFEYFLYTRGGPYWQTAKIPFSKFILCYQSRIQENLWPLPTTKIQNFSITATKYTGPFRLEISHIGLQLDSRNYQEFDYEGYFRPEFV